MRGWKFTTETEITEIVGMEEILSAEAADKTLIKDRNLGLWEASIFVEACLTHQLKLKNSYGVVGVNTALISIY